MNLHDLTAMAAHHSFPAFRFDVLLHYFLDRRQVGGGWWAAERKFQVALRGWLFQRRTNDFTGCIAPDDEPEIRRQIDHSVGVFRLCEEGIGRLSGYDQRGLAFARRDLESDRHTSGLIRAEQLLHQGVRGVDCLNEDRLLTSGCPGHAGAIHVRRDWIRCEILPHRRLCGLTESRGGYVGQHDEPQMLIRHQGDFCIEAVDIAAMLYDSVSLP